MTTRARALLGHTFGQFLDLFLPPVLDSETHKPFLQRLAGLGCAHALQLGQIHCLVADLHLAVESPLFRQIAYLFDIRLRYRTTVEQNFSTISEPFSGFDPVNAELIRKEILRLKDEGATIILSTHNMESVEELCDNIALINKSHLVITGGVNEIRHKYGNNNIELVYTGEDKVKDAEGIFKVLSDEDNAGRHTAVLTLGENVSSNDALSVLLGQDIIVNSFKELIPRMNDIFIKLVTEEA